MTTEIQIRKKHTYLPLLRKIVACVAARLGMNRKCIQEAQETVSEICAESIEAAGGAPDSNLSIKLDTYGDYVSMEITDPCVDFDPVCSGDCFGSKESEERLARVFNLADKVELVRGSEGTTIRVIKYARALSGEPARPLHQSHTSTLHA